MPVSSIKDLVGVCLDSVRQLHHGGLVVVLPVQNPGGVHGVPDRAAGSRVHGVQNQGSVRISIRLSVLVPLGPLIIASLRGHLLPGGGHVLADFFRGQAVGQYQQRKTGRYGQQDAGGRTKGKAAPYRYRLLFFFHEHSGTSPYFYIIIKIITHVTFIGKFLNSIAKRPAKTYNVFMFSGFFDLKPHTERMSPCCLTPTFLYFCSSPCPFWGILD